MEKYNISTWGVRNQYHYWINYFRMDSSDAFWNNMSLVANTAQLINQSHGQNSTEFLAFRRRISNFWENTWGFPDFSMLRLIMHLLWKERVLWWHLCLQTSYAKSEVPVLQCSATSDATCELKCSYFLYAIKFQAKDHMHILNPNFLIKIYFFPNIMS